MPTYHAKPFYNLFYCILGYLSYLLLVLKLSGFEQSCATGYISAHQFNGINNMYVTGSSTTGIKKLAVLELLIKPKT